MGYQLAKHGIKRAIGNRSPAQNFGAKQETRVESYVLTS